jgi:iron-sulfur cluster assembly protein
MDTEKIRIGNEKLIKLTGSAGDKVNNLLSKEVDGSFLRVRIAGGGCNGLSYKLKFDTQNKAGDILVETGGAKVIVDKKSALYLRGTLLDYSNSMIGGGFKFSNPNATSSCSCGESFSV